MTVLSFPLVSLLSVRVLHPACVCLLMLREGMSEREREREGGRSPFLLNSRHFAVRPHSHLPLLYTPPSPFSLWLEAEELKRDASRLSRKLIHAHTLRREEEKETERETIYYKLEQPMIGWKEYIPSCINIHFRLELTGRIKEEGPCVFDDEHDTADDGIMYGDQHNQPLIPQIQPRYGKKPKKSRFSQGWFALF